ncbi:MAG TPA: hypothetical protein VEJ63_23345 [Planctomycetota bacterium]|nr:hypothetical protein [Planctomycetota bacterium]
MRSLLFFGLLCTLIRAEDAPLPESWKDGLQAGVNFGLAAKYPGDANIKSDPDVFAVEDFETGKITLPYKEGDKWDAMMKVVEGKALKGKFCSQSTWKQGDNGGASRYWFPKDAHKGDRPAYFLRAYRKFDKNWHPGDVSKKVGLKGMGICCLKAKFDGRKSVTAGGKCDGTDWYTVEDQFVGYAGNKPGSQDGYYWFGHMYSYCPFPKEAVATKGEITVNEPPTTRFSLYANPKEFIKYEEWNCYELGLYLNTPGKYDGEARYWINGVLVARATKMCFRTIEDAWPEVATFNLYRTTENFEQEMNLWMDNIVIARRYIGPIKEGPAAPPKAEPKKAVATAPVAPPVPAIDAATFRAALIEKLAAASPSKDGLKLSIMGKPQNVTVAALGKNGPTLAFGGNSMPLRWKDLSDADLATLAVSVCAKDAEALYNAGAIAKAAKAESELQAVHVALAPLDAEKAKALNELGKK